MLPYISTSSAVPRLKCGMDGGSAVRAIIVRVCSNLVHHLCTGVAPLERRTSPRADNRTFPNTCATEMQPPNFSHEGHRGAKYFNNYDCYEERHSNSFSRTAGLWNRPYSGRFPAPYRGSRTPFDFGAGGAARPFAAVARHRSEHHFEAGLLTVCSSWSSTVLLQTSAFTDSIAAELRACRLLGKPWRIQFVSMLPRPD
ncbi:uncharacterized protein LOC125942437 [Dermacentor silvarum]|uniref:uncharacterized protein LOC125942437 n=1 Tax=Dermacentor silvarum TaxID=543639 RepID=UPI002101AB0D|nr:uncharacterized protein LOC125942437 [Dermacentor silvarum]